MKATVWDITRMTDVEIEANEGFVVFSGKPADHVKHWIKFWCATEELAHQCQSALDKEIENGGGMHLGSWIDSDNWLWGPHIYPSKDNLFDLDNNEQIWLWHDSHELDFAEEVDFDEYANISILWNAWVAKNKFESRTFKIVIPQIYMPQTEIMVVALNWDWRWYHTMFAFTVHDLRDLINEGIIVEIPNEELK